jgi:aryl-alcohol dehydrogenase-like predicted oxidoreductase
VAFWAGNRKRDEGDPTARAKSDGFAKDMYYQPQDFDVVDAVSAIAQEKGFSPAQIALAWLLHKPGVTAPIIGATKMYQLEEAVGAVEISLSDEEMARIEAPYKPHPILGHQ